MDLVTKQNEWQLKEEARRQHARELHAKHPYLIPDTGNSLVTAAKNIRIELKRAFSDVKFSVTTSRFSGGDSIDVSWTDGPTSKQVNKIINKYSAGTFDGMTDYYTYDHSDWTEAFGDGKYVHGKREFSDGAMQSAINQSAKDHGTNQLPTVEDMRRGRAWSMSPEPTTNGNHDYWSWQGIVYRALDEHDFCQVKAELTIEEKIARLEKENEELRKRRA